MAAFDLAVLRNLQAWIQGAEQPDRKLEIALVEALCGRQSSRCVPRVAEGATRSIDAVAELVERVLPGWEWMTKTHWAKLWITGREPPGNNTEGVGANAALALCAALVAVVIARAKRSEAIDGVVAIGQELGLS